MKMALAVSLMKTAGVPSLMHFFAHSGLVGVKLPELARPVAQPASENQPIQVTDFDVSPARVIAAVTKQMSGRTIHGFDDTRRQRLVNARYLIFRISYARCCRTLVRNGTPFCRRLSFVMYSI